VVPAGLYREHEHHGAGRRDRDKGKIGDYKTERTGPVELRS
jgi:hypothetical protein